MKKHKGHEIIDIFEDTEPQKIDKVTKWLIALLVVGIITYIIIGHAIGCTPETCI